MRKPIIAGNWKMYKTIPEAIALVDALAGRAGEFGDVEVVICPPFTALEQAAKRLRGTPMALGAQDCHWETQGAFTGEVAPGMLTDAGCAYVILGHSERRQYFGETDERINQKALACLAQRLRPIICVGETLGQRQANETLHVIERQLRECLKGLTAAQLAQSVIAYEPVWAIGTGQNATPAQAQNVHTFIRDWLAQQHGAATAAQVRIQYGGSVKPENALELMRQTDIDGGLIGGASLQAEAFVRIIAAAKEAMSSKGAACSR